MPSTTTVIPGALPLFDQAVRAADVVAQRQARADQALARVRAGEDFTKVARELSEDANREAGGELGMRPADRLPDLFVTATTGLAGGSPSGRGGAATAAARRATADAPGAAGGSCP